MEIDRIIWLPRVRNKLIEFNLVCRTIIGDRSVRIIIVFTPRLA